MARFANGKAPFIRKTDDKSFSTTIIMRDFLIGLVPVILFAWYKNGIQVYLDGNITLLEMFYPLAFMLSGGLLAVVYESIFFYITKKETRNLKGLLSQLKVSYAPIPGLLLAMIMAPYTPFWVLVFGVFFATIVGKMLFGGFGFNIFNPALIGRAAIAFTLTGVILAAGGYLNASEVLIDGIAGATPLQTLQNVQLFDYNLLVKPYGNLWDFFIGTIPGGLAETSALVILISYVWLSVRKVIKWFTPLVYIGTVFILSWLIGIASGEPGIWVPIYSIFSGGVMFGAVFMITEPVTSPKNSLGKIVFAMFIGIFTVLFRFVGSLPEGVATAIILMNIFTMPIDKWTAVIRSSGVNKKTAVKVAVLAVLLIVIALYTVLKAGSIYEPVVNTILSVWGRF